jgi:putative phosphoesterase
MTTRIGLISDVHGNLPALEAVLDDMPAVDRLLHAGDVIGYNPWPREVIERFERESVDSILGNHDRALLGDQTFAFNSMAGRAVDWTESALDARHLAYLEGLPVEERFVDGRVHVAHGAPGTPDRYTYPDAFHADLLPDGADALVLGHTHVQGDRSFDEGVVVNPGSVGQPRDGDPRSGYGVLTLDDGGVQDVSLYRVEYPIHEVQRKVEEYGLPQRIADRLGEGR